MDYNKLQKCKSSKESFDTVVGISTGNTKYLYIHLFKDLLSFTALQKLSDEKDDEKIQGFPLLFCSMQLPTRNLRSKIKIPI